MIKKLFILFALATSFSTILADDEPIPDIHNSQGKGNSHRAPKRQRQTAVTVTIENGVLYITSLRGVGNVSILITDVQTAEETEYTADFPEAGTECIIELPEGEYLIEIAGEGIHWQYYI
jgi:hypothetical protein